MIESLPGHYAAGSAAASPPTDQSHPTAVLNVSAYKFVALEDLADLRTSLKQRAAAAELKGTILLATEGINLFLAGEAGPLRVFLNELQADSRFAGLPVKESWSEGQPFSRLLVKLKKEIIPFGLPGVDPARSPGRKISPAELKTWLDAGRELTLLDTRNGYEVALGTFRGAVDLDIDHFREFPAKVEALPREARQRPLVMFCTGGIRCEKAAPFVEQAGFREVYQLDGGILRYFEECGSSHYDGDCFVFDDRVAVRPDLAASGATLCYACQRVLTADEIASPLYSRGVSCPHCYRGREQILADELAKRQRAFDALAADPPGLRPYLNVRPIRVPRHLAGRSLLECLLTLMPATDETYWRAEANRELLRFASEQSSRRDGQNSANAEVPTLDRVMREGERVDHLEPECVEPVVDAAIRLIDCDELLVVVHKPSGLPSHASGRYNRHTLEYLARRVFEPELVRLTHRLDANTAGVLVLARRFAAAKSVQQQFAEGAVRKRYVARVLGHPAADRFSCDARISREPAPGGVRTVDPVGGLNAVTEFTVLRRLDDGTSLLEARPLSGRTNQIRCHLWHLRMPIENDPAYLPGGELGVNRTLLPGEPAMRLFAAEIELAHPADGQLRKWTAAPPAWTSAWLKP